MANSDDDMPAFGGAMVGAPEPLWECWGCGKSVPLAKLTKKYGGRLFEPPCMAATRAFIRQHENDEEKAPALNQFWSDFQNDPKAFQLALDPWINNRSSARADAKRKFSETNSDIKYRGSENQQPDMVLDKIAFGSYMSFWRRMPFPECDALFDKWHAEQKGADDSKGIEYVRFAGNRQIMNYNGERNEEGVHRKETISEQDAAIKRRRITSKRPEEVPAQTSDVQPRREASPARAFSVHSAQSRSSMSGGSSSAHDPAGLAPQPHRAPTTPGADAVRANGPMNLSQGSGGNHVQDKAAPAAVETQQVDGSTKKEKKKSRGKNKLLRDLKDIPAADEHMEPQDFMDRQKALKIHFQDTLKEYTVASGFIKTMEKSLARLGSSIEITFKPCPKAVLEKSKSEAKALEDIFDELGKANSSNLAGMETKGMEGVQALVALKPDVKKAIDGLKGLISDMTSQKRSTYMREYHQIKTVVFKMAVNLMVKSFPRDLKLQACENISTK